MTERRQFERVSCEIECDARFGHFGNDTYLCILRNVSQSGFGFEVLFSYRDMPKFDGQQVMVILSDDENDFLAGNVVRTDVLENGNAFIGAWYSGDICKEDVFDRFVLKHCN